MPYTPPKVFYSATSNGSYTELTGIQSININRGRQRAQDPFNGSSCVIELIPANSYALPLALGQFVDVRDSNSGTSPCYYSGRIIDVQRRYDMPYNAGTGAAPGDRITLTISGGVGAISTQVLESAVSTTAGLDAITQITAFEGRNVTTEFNGNPTYPPPSFEPVYAGVFVSSQTFNVGTPNLSIISTLLNMAQWTIDDGDYQRLGSGTELYKVEVYPSGATGATVTFTDDGTAGYRYQAIEYVSSLQSSFSTVAVEPAGLARQVEFNASAALNSSLTISTYDQTTTQADNLAAYVLLVSAQAQPAPFMVETSSAATDTAGELGRFMTYPVGTTAVVKFRGSTVFATVQGWSIAYYPDMARVRCFLSPSLGTSFTLDSTSFGVLDTNRLGYP